MNFLKKLFNIGKPEDSDQKRGLSPEMYDLLLDWFNESGTNITSFENDFFEPIIKIYRTNDNKNQYKKGRLPMPALICRQSVTTLNLNNL